MAKAAPYGTASKAPSHTWWMRRLNNSPNLFIVKRLFQWLLTYLPCNFDYFSMSFCCLIFCSENGNGTE